MIEMEAVCEEKVGRNTFYNQQIDQSLKEYRESNPEVPWRDWNNDACMALACVMIENAKNAYIDARYKAIKQEQKVARLGDKAKAYDHINLIKYKAELRHTERYFHTELFSALTLGKVSIDECIAQFDRECDKILAGNKGPVEADAFGNYVPKWEHIGETT